MRKQNQKGTGLVELLIIILVVLALIAAGWFVMNAKKKSQSETPSKPQASANSADKPAQKPQAAPKKYLEIKELSIKIELNAATDDAYYTMKNGYAYLSLTSLKDIEPECGADKTGVVAIGKYNKTDTDEQSGKTYADLAAASGKVIGNDAYYMSRSQAYCSQDNEIQQKQQAAWDGFKAQASTIQAL